GVLIGDVVEIARERGAIQKFGGCGAGLVEREHGRRRDSGARPSCHRPGAGRKKTDVLRELALGAARFPAGGRKGLIFSLTINRLSPTTPRQRRFERTA